MESLMELAISSSGYIWYNLFICSKISSGWAQDAIFKILKGVIWKIAPWRINMHLDNTVIIPFIINLSFYLLLQIFFYFIDFTHSLFQCPLIQYQRAYHTKLPNMICAIFHQDLLMNLIFLLIMSLHLAFLYTLATRVFVSQQHNAIAHAMKVFLCSSNFTAQFNNVHYYVAHWLILTLASYLTLVKIYCLIHLSLPILFLRAFRNVVSLSEVL